MTAPLISVLMPAYNHQAYVGAAIASVLGQSHARLELIVVDDASSDATWEIVSACGDERLRAVRHDTNQGAHASLNEAMSMARGDYLAILNSDDIHAPKRLERLLAAAQASAGLVFSDVEFIDEQGAAVAEHERAVDYRSLCATCARLAPRHWFLAGNPAISSSNFFVSRRLAEQIGDFAPLRYTHDWDWALRAVRHAEPVWLREPLLGYRVHAGNTLSEDDAWRHIHENSFVQARALMAWPSSEDPRSESQDVCRALLTNKSLHPLSLNCYLINRLCGITDEALLALTTEEAGHWLLRDLAEATHPSHGPLFHSLARLGNIVEANTHQAQLLDERYATIQAMSGIIAERDRALHSQEQLIEERWRAMQDMEGMIQERDKEIAVLHKSQTTQAALLEDRYQAILDMGREIALRQDEMLALRREIDELRADRWVAYALRIRGAYRALRSFSGR